MDFFTGLFRSASPLKRVERQLVETVNLALEATAAREYFSAIEDMYNQRLSRLKKQFVAMAGEKGNE